tara:strand:- start:564 stop:1196 length:633 start_codon:yes stop_codon:yes gene_type:complete
MSLYNNLWGVPVYKVNTNYTYSKLDQNAKDLIDKHISFTKSNSDSVNVIIERGKFLEDIKLVEIKKLIDSHAHYFRDNFMMCTNELETQASWLTINHKGSKHPQHNHPHAIFSVCYYPRAESGSLVLIAPDGKNTWQKEYRLGFQYTQFNEWNSLDWSIPVLSGDIVIFPGWVSHFTSPNESDNSRIMIGANYWLRGEMKFEDELDSIRI